MSKKSKAGQWAHYKKWTTSEGYTFMALNVDEKSNGK